MSRQRFLDGHTDSMTLCVCVGVCRLLEFTFNKQNKDILSGPHHHKDGVLEGSGFVGLELGLGQGQGQGQGLGFTPAGLAEGPVLPVFSSCSLLVHLLAISTAGCIGATWLVWLYSNLHPNMTQTCCC